MLPLLATAVERVTPLEKLQNVSGQFWLKIFRKVMVMNKIILTIILGVIGAVVSINWVYNRTEPEFLTPMIDAIANTGFFPTKGHYENKQQQDPGKDPGKSGQQKGTPSSTTPASKK
jgi:hypothetical protein